MTPLKIGDVRMQLEGIEENAGAFSLYAPFLDDGPADIRLEMAQGEPQPPPGQLLVDAFPDWRIWGTAEGMLYEVFDAREPHPRIHWALMNETLTEGSVWIEREGASLGRLMEPLGQLLLMARWAQRQAYMVHALAVDDQGVGRAFVGASGTGKSTLARWYQAEGLTVLSDERVVLQLDGDRLLAYGTPWPGMAWSGSPGPVEVETLYFLQHAARHALEPVTPSEALALLYPQLFLLSRDHAEVKSALGWCERLLATVPVARLAFVKDPSVLEYMRSAASQNATSVVR